MAVQRKHLDFERRLLTVFTKGGRIYPIPVIEEWIWRRLGELELEADWHDDHFLLYGQQTRKVRVPLAEAEETLDIGKGETIGYATRTRRDHTKKVSRARAHAWWYGCLQRAGVVAEGTTSGMHMHRGRHTAATEIQRAQHDLRLTQLLLGHKDIRSTARYTQLDTADLELALRNLYEDTEG